MAATPLRPCLPPIWYNAATCVCVWCYLAVMQRLYPAFASGMPRGLLVLLGRDGESGWRVWRGACYAKMDAL